MATSEEETIPTTLPITLEGLKLQLYHPPPSQSPMFQESSFNPSSCQKSLSFIPWNLLPVGQDPSTTAELSSSADGTSSDPLSQPPPSSSSVSVSFFPKEDYLELRRQQNLAWAENRLVQGNEHYYLDATKADEYYQEGLKLCPDHIPLLVAQAKLWIFRRNRPQAAKTQLEHCLHLDPHHASDAKELLERWHRIDASRKQAHHHSSSSKALPQMRESSSAFQNALMERNLAMNSSTNLGLEEDVEEEDDDDEVQEDENDNKDKDNDDQDSNQHYSSSHKKKKKRKSKKKTKYDKKHDKKKKRRKRKRHDSSSDDDDGNDDDDSISKDDSDRSSLDDRIEHRRRRRRRSRHSRHHKQKRREDRNDSSPDDSTANHNGHGISKLKTDDDKDKHSPVSLS